VHARRHRRRAPAGRAGPRCASATRHDADGRLRHVAGRIPLDTGAWHVDYAYRAPRSAWERPPALPIAVPSAMTRSPSAGTLPFSLDPAPARGLPGPAPAVYTAPRRSSSSTRCTSARSVLVEGLAARWQRPPMRRAPAAALIDRGFVLLADPAHQLAPRPPCGAREATTAETCSTMRATPHRDRAARPPPHRRCGDRADGRQRDARDRHRSWRRSTWCWTGAGRATTA